MGFWKFIGEWILFDRLFGNNDKNHKHSCHNDSLHNPNHYNSHAGDDYGPSSHYGRYDIDNDIDDDIDTGLFDDDF